MGDFSSTISNAPLQSVPSNLLMETRVLLSTLTFYWNQSDKLNVDLKCGDSECNTSMSCSLTSEGRSAVPRKQ